MFEEHSAELIALLALVGPALLLLGVWLGSIRASTRSAHHRIDQIEDKLTSEFKQMREALTHSLERAWMNCPLAREGHVQSGEP